ncbi:MAG: hypothetical protein U0X73_10255 [Thermoanaerobaculia bacterium]
MSDFETGNEAFDAELRRLLRGRGTRADDPDCPREERWIALAAGEAAADEADLLRRHLEGCAACAATAADARRFLLAMGSTRPAPTFARSGRRVLIALAASLAIAGIAWLIGDPRWRPAPDPIAELVATLELPAAPESESTAGGVTLRGAEISAASRSLAAALVAYRDRRFAAACDGLADHGRRFPADREARFLAAVSCLEARELDRAEALLASLAAVAGDRRDDSRRLLDRLRAARRDADR